MPPGGGINAKISAYYEDRIAVSHLLDLLDDQHDSCCVRFEQPGDDGFEWWVERSDGSRQYTQVKRQLARDTSWSISNLAKMNPSERSVLEDIRVRLSAETGAECVFASTISATHLQDLTESARLAADFREFEEKLVISDPKSKSLETVRGAWGGVSGPEAWGMLRRIRVRMLDSDSLDRLLNAQSRMLIAGPTTDAVPVLENFVCRHLCQMINAKQAWDELREVAGLEPTDWHQNSNHMLRIGEQTRRLRERINGERDSALRLARPGTKQAADWLLAPIEQAPQVITLVGEAGVGKSGALVEILDRLDEAALESDGTRPVVLAARVDRLGEFHDAIGLGTQMHLPGSPAVVLARAAGRQRAVLVLDQIDAFGVGSGRNPGALEAIEDVVADARALKVRVVLVCRAFEMEADYRIRRLIGVEHSSNTGRTHRTVDIGELATEQVLEALADEQMDGAALPSRLIDLLSVPLHLHMLILLHRRGRLDSGHIRTRLQLFDDFYDSVIEQVRIRDQGAQPEAATGRLAELLSARQALSAPEAELSPYRSTVRLLVSEGWLRSADGKVGFAHEAFFDYAYAHQHLASGISLLTLLGTRDDQRLFRRSQIRQILLLERDQDRDTYLRDVHELLAAQNLRPHLKEVVIALVTRVPDPQLDEWDAMSVLGPVPANPLAEHAHALAAQAPAFSALLLDHGVLAGYLQDPATVPVGVWLSRLMVNRYPEQIAALFAPRVGDETWAPNVAQILNAAQLSQHEHLIDLFVAYMDAGHADAEARATGHDNDFFDRCYGLNGTRASWCARLVAAWLRRRLEVNIADHVWATTPEESGPAAWAFSDCGRLLAPSNAAHEILTTLAREDPIAYANHLLPPVRAAVLAARTGAVYDSGEQDRVFAARTWIAPLYDPDLILFDQLLDSVRVAVERDHTPTLAAVRDMADSLLAAEQALAAAGFAAGHPDLADAALHWLEHGPHALAQGHTGDHYALSAKVLGAVSRTYGSVRCASAQQRAAGYVASNEQAPRLVGKAARRLLRDIPDEQLDVTAASRLPQQQGFRERDAAAADLLADDQQYSDVTVRTVASPISAAQLARMDDEELLETLRVWSDRPIEYRPSAAAVGGTDHVALSVSESTAEHPDRFARLLSTLPEDLDPIYRLRILEGLDRAVLSAPQLSRIVSAELARPGAHLYALSRLLHRAATTVQKAHDADTGAGIIALVETLLSHPGLGSPTAIDLTLPPHHSLRPQQPTPAHVLTQQLSGHLHVLPQYYALRALTDLADEMPAAARALAAQTSRLSILPDPASRVLALAAAYALLRVDHAAALETLRSACSTPAEQEGHPDEEAEHLLVLASHELLQLMLEAGWRHYDIIAPAITSVLHLGSTSGNSVTSSLAALAKQRAASALAIAAIRFPQAAVLLENLDQAEEAVRSGVAEGLATYAALGPYFPTVSPILCTLFDDPVDEIASKAATALRDLTGKNLEASRTILEAALNSRSFTLIPGETVRAAARLAREFPDLLLTIAARFIQLRGRQASDLSTSTPQEAKILAGQVLSLCDSAGATSIRALDILDDMVLARIFGLEGLLAVTDR